MIQCEPLEAAIGFRHQSIVCNVTAKEGEMGNFMCDKLSWEFVSEGKVIQDGVRDKDASGELDIRETKCKVIIFLPVFIMQFSQ